MADCSIRVGFVRREQHSDAQRRLAGLTPRQQEVVELIVAGCDDVAIARRLKMSMAMVETHRRRIMAALGIDNLAELMRIAIDAGSADPVAS